MKELQVICKDGKYQIRTVPDSYNGQGNSTKSVLICTVDDETLAHSLKALIQHYGSTGNLYKDVKQLW